MGRLYRLTTTTVAVVKNLFKAVSMSNKRNPGKPVVKRHYFTSSRPSE